MKKVTSKLLKVSLSAALAAPFVLSTESFVTAATAPTSGTVKFIAQDDDTAKFVTGKNVTLTKLSVQTGEILGYDKAWTSTSGVEKATDTNGASTFDNVDAGNYALTIDLGSNTTFTKFVSYKPKATATEVKAVVLPTKADVNITKSGAIGGNVLSKSGTSAVETSVIVVGKDSAWTTKTDANGAFKVYVPSGTYDVIVVGKDSTGDNVKNQVYKAVKVQAGQTASPLDSMVGDETWAVDENKFAYTELKTTAGKETFSNVSKEYKGTLNRDAKVSAYSVDDKGTASDATDDVYTLLAETTAKYNSTTKLAPFSLKLPAAQPGKKVKVIVQDTAYNTYVKDYAFASLDPKFVADTTQNEIAKDIDISYTDETKTFGSSNLVVKVKVKGADDSTYVTLAKSTGTTADKIKDYKVASGKITILSKTFVEKFDAKPQDYTFSITDAGFDSTKAAVEQKINASTTNAASLSVTASKGTTGTKLTVTAGTGNKIKYVKSSTLPTAAKLYQSVPTEAVDYTTNDEITGVNASTNKYLGVYEVNSKGLVVKFKTLALTAAQVVAAPAAPTGLIGVAATTAGNDGKITGTTTAMEYKLASEDDTNYKAATADETTGLAAGDYVVRVKASGSTPASATTAVTVAGS